MSTRAISNAVAKMKTAETARREHRRAIATSFWGQQDDATRQRTAMIIAAFLLDESDEHDLADWLLCAKPAHAKQIATGVAVHALRENYASVWDALAAADSIDMAQADEWYFDEKTFDWAPETDWLTSRA